MLGTLSLVCREFYKRCSPRLWQHPHLRGFTDLADIIRAIESKPALAHHIQSVAFMCGADDTKKHREHINTHMDCWPSCFYELPGNEKIRAVWEGQDDVDVREPGNEWGAAMQLPQKFLHQLDAHGLPPNQRSYAFSFDAPWKWYESFMNAMLALPPSDPDAHIMRCFCFEGDTHRSLSRGIVKPTALHLYGRPIDWTHHESPRNNPTFARFPRVKCIVFSIHTWHDDDDDHCNIFERCYEYDQYHSKGTLEKVIVRMTPGVSGKVRKAFEGYKWPRGRDIVEFRLWDIAGIVPNDEVVAHELRNGTWHDWLERPDVLGRKLSLADLDDLANAVPPISPGGFPASPPLPREATPDVASKFACRLPPDPNQSPTPNYVTIRC